MGWLLFYDIKYNRLLKKYNLPYRLLVFNFKIILNFYFNFIIVSIMYFLNIGGMAEWFMAHAWKACWGSRPSGVQIPLPPP